MKSGKQRRKEIQEKRKQKSITFNRIDSHSDISNMPLHGAIKADHSQLIHIGSCYYHSPLPNFYLDKAFTCRDCSSKEIWTARQQKWWYEIAKGHIDSTAVRCRRCRNALKEKKQQQQQHMKNMAQKEHHPNEAFFKRRLIK